MRGKAFNIAENSKIYTFLDKKTSGVDTTAVNNENITNKELAEELHKPKPNIRKIEKRKVHWLFIANIWAADLADMQLIRKLNKGIRFLLHGLFL